MSSPYPSIASLVVALYLANLTACGSSGGVVIEPGGGRTSTDPTAVRVFLSPPSEPYEVVGRVKGTSIYGWSQQQDRDRALTDMREQAAKLGAEGVIVIEVIDSAGNAIALTQATAVGDAIVFSGTQGVEAPSPEPGKPTISSGSGVVVDSNEQLVLSNNHVVENCREISLSHLGTKFGAKLLFTDPEDDLALLFLDGSYLGEEATFRKESPVRLGEDIVAVGFPLSDILGESIRSTSGTVSSASGIGGDTRMFQLSAPLQPGNSGGPVIDGSGLVVGIAAAKLDEIVVASVTGSIPQNVNFGIKNDVVFRFLDTFGISPRMLNSADLISRPEAIEQATKFVVQVQCIN